MKTKSYKTQPVMMWILKKIILLILIFIVCYNLVYVVGTSFGNNEFSFFSFKTFVMADKSMVPALKLNDVVITKNCKASDLAEGDIIAFDLNGSAAIGRIAMINSEGYIIKGDNNFYFYEKEVSISQVKGKEVKVLTKMGILFYIIQSKITTVIIMLWLVFYYVRVRNLKKRSMRRRAEKDIQAREASAE